MKLIFNGYGQTLKIRNMAEGAKCYYDKTNKPTKNTKQGKCFR